MNFLQDFFGSAFRGISGPQRAEAEKLIEELLRIGHVDDFLAERPGPGFNAQCRNVRARQIGTRLHQIGGLGLMQYAHRKTKKKLGANLAAHLEYAWDGIENWVA